MFVRSGKSPPSSTVVLLFNAICSVQQSSKLFHLNPTIPSPSRTSSLTTSNACFFSTATQTTDSDGKATKEKRKKRKLKTKKSDKVIPPFIPFRAARIKEGIVDRKDLDDLKVEKAILGLCISTKSVGYTLFKDAMKECGEIDLSSGNDFFDKSLIVKRKLLEMKDDIEKNFTKLNGNVVVGIEQVLGGFGSVSAITPMIERNKINSVVSYICHEIFNTKPISITATSARTTFGVKKAKKQSTDELRKSVLEIVSKEMPFYSWKRNRSNTLDPCNVIVSDSFVIANAALVHYKESLLTSHPKYLKFFKEFMSQNRTKINNHKTSLTTKEQREQFDVDLQGYIGNAWKKYVSKHVKVG